MSPCHLSLVLLSLRKSPLGLVGWLPLLTTGGIAASLGPRGTIPVRDKGCHQPSHRTKKSAGF